MERTASLASEHFGGSDLNRDRWLRPVIIHSSTPKQCSWVQQVAIPYIPSHISNFGHNLLDNVMSFYRLLKLFDFDSHDTQFVPLRMLGMDSKREMDTTILSKVLVPFVGSTNSADGYFFPNVLAGNHCLCFENVISGKYHFHTDHGMDESRHGRLPHFNPFYVGRGRFTQRLSGRHSLRDFRDAYMIRAGCRSSCASRQCCSIDDNPIIGGIQSEGSLHVEPLDGRVARCLLPFLRAGKARSNSNGTCRAIEHGGANQNNGLQ